jgi:hypothetical protein
MDISIELEWLEEPAFDVRHGVGQIAVTAHAGLSEHQVKAACDQIDEYGDAVFAAWRDRVNVAATAPGGG